MNPATYADYCWLVEDEGRRWLDWLADQDDSLVRLTRALRKELSSGQVHLLLEQRELRARAREKFPHGDMMFFTRRALEQATDYRIARYKATRFPAGGPIADLCCGIGGDLVAIGKRGPAIGVDSDPIVALLAKANAAALDLLHVAVLTEDAATFPLGGFGAWHIDPDRRAHSGRTSRPEFSQPSFAQWLDLLARCGDGAIKLAPAARLPDDFARGIERQWIGSRRECRQQVAWTGSLTQHPGQRTAIVIDNQGEPSQLLAGTDDDPTAPLDTIQHYVYEPHAAVRAAGLGHCLASRFGLRPFAPAVAYLTSERCVTDALVDTFEVITYLPLDIRRLRAVLKDHDLDPREIKTRHVPIDPIALRKRLRHCGAQPATLLLAPHMGHTLAIVARRCLQDSTMAP